MSGEESISTAGSVSAYFMINVNYSALMAFTTTQKGLFISMISIPPDLAEENLRE